MTIADVADVEVNILQADGGGGGSVAGDLGVYREVEADQSGIGELIGHGNQMSARGTADFENAGIFQRRGVDAMKPSGGGHAIGMDHGIGMAFVGEGIVLK